MARGPDNHYNPELMSEQEQRTISILNEAIGWVASVADEGFEHWLVEDMAQHVKDIEKKLL